MREQPRIPAMATRTPNGSVTVAPDRFLHQSPVGNTRLPDLPGADLELNGTRS
jgi:hypothetical protein